MDFQANIDKTKQFTKPKHVILYVTNLPVELNKEGVSEIFNYYGKIVSLFYRPNTSWAFITYETYKEAESAIRDLHDIPPLYLKVSLKVETINNDDNTQKIEGSEHTDIINKQEHQSPIQKYYEDDDFLHPICTRSSSANSSTIFKNSLWTRGTVTATSDGKRHISYGRGYTFYEIPDPHPEIGTLIEQVYDKRENVLYEHGQDSLKHIIGKCIYCARPSRTKCERCNYFYCTRKCQEKDWPRHKYECKQTPALIKDATSLSTSSSEKDFARLTSSSKKRTLRCPKTQVVTINQHMDNINAKCSINECQSNYEINNITQVNNDILTLITPNKNITEETKSISNIDALQIKNDIVFIHNQFLSRKHYIKVKVVSILKNSNYCVFKTNHKEKIMKMKRSLSDIAMTTCKVNPVVGNIYVHKFIKEYYRVQIISTNPTQVYFIDYHITKITNSDDFYELNSTKVVSFGIQIAMVKKKLKLHLYDIISVKKIYNKGNINIVNIKMEKDIHDQNSIISSNKSCNIDESVTESDLSGSILSTNDKTNKHNDIKKQKSICTCLLSVVDFLSEGECGLLQACTSLGNNNYGITLLPTKVVNEFNQILLDLPKYCNSVKQDNYKAAIGEIVCGKRTDDAWVRGLVISHQPLKLAVLDTVTIESVQKVVSYPDFLQSIYKYGVICNVITKKFKLQVQVHYKFKVLSCIDDITIEIYTDESEQLLNAAKAVIKPWVPKIGQCDIKFNELKTKSEIYGIKFAELKTESEICIAYFQNLTEIYVYSIEAENVSSFHNIMQRVGILAQSAPYLKEPPGVGEMVIAKYIDDNYYRAIVTNIKKKQVDIYYIDYGNTTTIPWKNLQVLSDDLKQEPSCITKIALKNIPTNVPVNKDVSDYFLDLIVSEVHLLCHLEDLSSTNNVSLTLPNGESVNDKIKKLLIPSWEKDNEEDKTVYMFDDGSADNVWTKGSTIDVIVLSIFKPGTDYVMCSTDEDLVKHVYEILPPLINDYCKKANYYIPRIGELCFGLYNGVWYRAYCIDPTVSEKESLLFYVDYGNTEHLLHENIRAMTKDFLTPDFLANICTVVNLVPEDEHEHISPNVLKRISELISVSERVSIKIVEVIGKNQYIIELPQIRATLIKENLIS